MATPGSGQYSDIAGSLGAIAGVATASFFAFLGIWHRFQASRREAEGDDDRSDHNYGRLSVDARADAVRANLDDATKEVIDELRKDKKEARTDRVLWERRARRADRIAHEFRHMLINERMAVHGFNAIKPDPIPYLEDDFTDPAEEAE